MEQEKIINEISNLPPDAQRQVVDFIAFLKTRYRRSREENDPDEQISSMSHLLAYGKIVKI